MNKKLLRYSMPIAMGYIPIGMTFGILAVSQGLAWYWVPLMSFLIFAGAMQFLAINLLITKDPLWSIVVTTLLVNFRHIFYGLSIPFQKFTRWQKIYLSFNLTDEVYSLIVSKKEELNQKEILLLGFFSHFYWILGSSIGALISLSIPGTIKGTEFAITALFIVLAQEYYYNRSNWMPMKLGIVVSILIFMLHTSQFLTYAIVSFLIVMTPFYFKTLKAYSLKDEPFNKQEYTLEQDPHDR